MPSKTDTRVDRPRRAASPYDESITVIEAWSLKVPQPQSAIDDEPRVSLCFNEEYVPLLVTLFDQLVDWWSWRDATSEGDFAPQQFAALLSQLLERVPCGGEEDDFCMTISQEIIDAICACVSAASVTIVNNNNSNAEISNYFAQADDTVQGAPDTLLEEPVSTSSLTPLGEPVSCTDEDAYGAALSIIGGLDDLAQRYLDAADNAVDLAEDVVEFFLARRVGRRVADVVTDIAEAFVQVGNFGANTYRNNYNQPYIDTVACELASIIKCNGCELSVRELAAFFASRAAKSYLITVSENAIWQGFPLYQAVANDPTFMPDVVFFQVVQSALRGGQIPFVGSYNVLDIQKIISDAQGQSASVPASCTFDECQWQYVWTAGDSTDDLLSIQTRLLDNWSIENELVYTQPSDTFLAADLTFDMPASAGLNYVGVEWSISGEVVNFLGDGFGFATVDATGTPSNSSSDAVNFEQLGDFSYAKDDMTSGQDRPVDIRISCDQLKQDGTAVIYKLVFRGNGVNPFV